MRTDEQILKLYEDAWSIKEISNKFRIDEGRVRSLIRRAEIRRKCQEAKNSENI